MTTVFLMPLLIIRSVQATLGPTCWGRDPSFLHVHWPGDHPYTHLRATVTLCCYPQTFLRAYEVALRSDVWASLSDSPGARMDAEFL